MVRVEAGTLHDPGLRNPVRRASVQRVRKIDELPAAGGVSNGRYGEHESRSSVVVALAPLERTEYRMGLPRYAIPPFVRSAADLVECAAKVSAWTLFGDRAGRVGRPRLVASEAGASPHVRPGLPRVVFAHSSGLARDRLRACIALLHLAGSVVRTVGWEVGRAVRAGSVWLDADRILDSPLLVSLHTARTDRHVLRVHDSWRAPCVS